MPTPSPAAFEVLVIDDSEEDRVRLRGLIEAVSQRRFVVASEAASIAEARRLVSTREPHVALLDLEMVQAGGWDEIRSLFEAAPWVPVIALSERDDDELAVQIVHAGAADCLVKSEISTSLLHRSIRYAIERAGAEAQLAQERDLLQALLESIPDRIYFKDRESRFIRINRALTELLRLSAPEEAYGRTDADFYDEVHAREARADEEAVMSSGEAVIGKVEHEILSDGRESWSLTTKLPLRNPRGEIVGTCGISREISALKQMEMTLSAERNLLRGVIDNLPDPIFLKDCNGRYLLDNAAHWQGLGASGPEEVLGRTVFDFFPTGIAEHFHENDQQILRTGRAQINHEEKTMNVKREQRWMLTTKVPWRDEGGGILGILCLSRDITEQKESAERLRQVNAELERRGKELQRALHDLQQAHLQMRSMQLELVEAEKMKTVGRLAAGIAHEVKNPLAVIRMGVEFLDGQAGSDETLRTVVHEMSDAVTRADHVIRGLLDFSLPRKLELAPTDLNRLIEHTLTLVRGEIRGPIEIVREFDRKLPVLSLDAPKISQVFVNVLANALHAMPKGGTLTVRTYTRQLTGVGSNIADPRSESFRVGQTLVVAEIDDTGEGIAEDKLAKVFEPFFTTKPTGQGTGLGLSVVKAIIDLHGGTIDLRNLPTGGARVTLMFRL